MRSALFLFGLAVALVLWFTTGDVLAQVPAQKESSPPPPTPPDPPEASAQVWFEVGDAGNLPATAQFPVGAGPFTTIIGALAVIDEDMYCIKIVNQPIFQAKTWPGTAWDSQLWLFHRELDGHGNGVTFNDDDAAGGGGLRSRITGRYVPGPGEYYLAISHYDDDALNAAGAQIWLDVPFGLERVPDGPGAPGPIAGWDGAAFGSGPYQIDLVGCTYCDQATPTEPTTWGKIKSTYR